MYLPLLVAVNEKMRQKTDPELTGLGCLPAVYFFLQGPPPSSLEKRCARHPYCSQTLAEILGLIAHPFLPTRNSISLFKNQLLNPPQMHLYITVIAIIIL